MTNAADIRAGDWIDRFVPSALRPYCRLARLDRPIGTWLLLFPCWWSVAMAAMNGEWPDLWLMTLFAIGAVVMRGAGCTVNDIVDRDIDAMVARTATRPLASGAIKLPQAFVFLGIQLALGLLVLAQMKSLAIWLGISSLSLIAIYPFMKRITWWPQAFLGITFNWGALLGYAAARGTMDWPPVLLYVAGFFWTLAYDTIYAHQDKIDDQRVGVRSTALLFGRATRKWLVAFDLLMLVFLVLSFQWAGLSLSAYVLLAGAAAHLLWQSLSVDLDQPLDCLAKFRASRWTGWILLFAIVIGRSWT